MRFAISVLVTVLLVSIAVAQKPAPVVPQVELPDPTSPVRTQLPRRGGILGAIACDKNGAIYLQPQFAPDPSGNVESSSDIVRLNSDGTVASFPSSVADASGTPMYVVAHAVDRDGRVFLLTMRPGPGTHVTVVELSPDASFVSKTDLDRELRPGLFAVLPSGDFLIGGTLPDSDKSAETRKSVLWLFGSDGSFKREFLATTSAAEINPQTKRPVGTIANIDFRSLQIGDDNSIYVLRPANPAKIDVFDEQGQKQRSLKLNPPKDARVGEFFFAGNGRVVVPYWSTEKSEGKQVYKRIFRVYDAQTGIAQIDWVSTFRAIVACLDNSDLVFLVTSKDGSLSIERASMR